MLEGSPQEKRVGLDLYSKKIRTVCISPKEDQIVFTTENNQLFKVMVNLERPSEDLKYEHVVASFHSKRITGLDCCIKKQLVATCSDDKTVRIWSYSTGNQFSLEICKQFDEEAFSLALHPSGFHIVVGFTNQIWMMNILDNDLVKFN